MKVKPYLAHLTRESYVDQKSTLRQEGILDCSLGTNPFGASIKVLKAAREYSWSQVWLYPDPSYKELTREICMLWSEHADLDPEQIQVSHGASIVLERLNKMLVGPGSRVLGYSPQFTEYITEVEACGGKYEAAVLDPDDNFKFHADRLLAIISSEHCLIYIDNPNNPTGQVIALQEIEEIVRQASTRDITVVVDEAYADYMSRENSAVNLINKYSNLVVVRSFSKGLGLAGLRVGYGILPPQLNHYYQKINLPFSVSSVSCYLAREALLDQDFLHNCRAMVQQEKKKLILGLREKGYLISESSESCPIFVLGRQDKDINLREELLKRGILTVAGTDFRNLGANYVRVNIPAQAEEFLSRL